MIVAGIIGGPAGGLVGELIRADQVAADHLDRVHIQFPRDPLHQPFQRVIDLRSAKAAVQAGGRLVRHDDAVAHRQVRDVIGPAQVAVHPVERRRLRRAQIGADIFDLVKVQRQHAGVVRDCSTQGDHPIGGRDRGGQMLQPVLDPLYRAVCNTGANGQQGDIGKDPLFDAKAAARIRRGAQAQTVAGHLQGAGQNRMDRKRPLKIRGDVIGVFVGIVFSQHAIGLDRCAGIAGIADIDLDRTVGGGKGRLGIAIAEVAVGAQIVAHDVMQNGGIFDQCALGVDHRRKAVIVDLDQIGGVFGDIAVIGQNHGDRLTDISGFVLRDGPAVDGQFQTHHQRRGKGGIVRASDHATHAGQGGSSSNFNGLNAGMSMQAAHHSSMQNAPRRRQIIKIPSASGQQCGVLDAHGGPGRGPLILGHFASPPR